MNSLEKTQLKLGYIPLLDCAAILWAQHQGLFTEVGLEVELVKEASWASLRDRLAFGFLDAAHCLSAILPASAINEDSLAVPLQTPLVLSQNRAFISLSQSLCFQLGIQHHDSAHDAASKVMAAFKQQPIELAYVFKHSIHHYCLREWFALADEQLAHHIQLKVLPPPFMVEALSKCVIDGFCVGEPWNTQGELLGVSQIVAKSQDIIPQVADKVLAVSQDWAQQHPHTLAALCTAIRQAQQQLQDEQYQQQLWQLLIEYEIIQFECSSSVHVQQYHVIQQIIRGFMCHDPHPKWTDFAWLIHQMQKWDHLELDEVQAQTIAQNCLYKIDKI